MSKPVKCPACDGLGFNAKIPKARDKKQTCPACEGKGILWISPAYEPVPCIPWYPSIPAPFYVQPYDTQPKITWEITSMTPDQIFNA